MGEYQQENNRGAQNVAMTSHRAEALEAELELLREANAQASQRAAADLSAVQVRSVGDCDHGDFYSIPVIFRIPLLVGSMHT